MTDGIIMMVVVHPLDEKQGGGFEPTLQYTPGG